TGTFSGKDCTGTAITNGTFTGTYAMTVDSATRFPMAGTWTAFLPSTFGGGSWTWTIAQGGDVNGGALSGSLAVSSDNTLHLGTGTITGTLTNVFPGAPSWSSAVTTVSFTGACPATLTFTWGDLSSNSAALSGDGLTLVAVNFSGSTCNGPVPTFKPSLKRQ